MSDSAYTRKWREEFKARDPEGYKAYRAEEARKYRVKHPEVPKAATRRWIEANPEKRAALQKAWFDKHPEYGNIWRLNNLKSWIHKSAKSRAKQKGLVFTISPEDIVIPEFCPILGVRLDPEARRGSPNALSLDRVIPEKGYVPGNVVVVSTRANFMKGDGTAREHELIALYIRAHGGGE